MQVSHRILERPYSPLRLGLLLSRQPLMARSSNGQPSSTDGNGALRLQPLVNIIEDLPEGTPIEVCAVCHNVVCTHRESSFLW